MLYILAVVFLMLFLRTAIRVPREYERGVVFRLGRVLEYPGKAAQESQP